MKSRFAERAFSALIYCQALLLFAGVASALLRDRSDAVDTMRGVEVHSSMTSPTRI